MSSTIGISEKENTKIVKIIIMSRWASIFELVQCVVEIIYVMFEFNNNKTKKEKIHFSEIFFGQKPLTKREQEK